jgi:hypothetical protein
LSEIKDRIKTAQSKAILSANAEMINMYWDIGEIIYFRQQKEGWGAGVIPKLAYFFKATDRMSVALFLQIFF